MINEPPRLVQILDDEKDGLKYFIDKEYKKIFLESLNKLFAL